MDNDEVSVVRLQRQHYLAVIELICVVVISFAEHGLFRHSQVPHELRPTGERVRDELLDFLNSSRLCHSVIRMSPDAFRRLCDVLVRRGGLKPTLRVTVEEQVAKSLWLLGHSVTNCEIQFFFRRSGETVSRHFHNVLDAINTLGEVFIKQPDGSDIPLEIFSNKRFYPHFKDCVGAIDGTHIRVKVANADAARYRNGRKEHPTLNVLAACTFDLKFTYILFGWEGTAPDSRVLRNALEKQDPPLQIPKGKYYLVDAGFMLRRVLITPYRGERYHLKEYSKNPPRSPRELFNHRHSSLRNAFERAFGVVKKRFPILGTTEPHYNVETTNQIILGCCVLHNFLMDVDPSEEILAEVDRELAMQDDSNKEIDEDNTNLYREGEIFRDAIAASMWNDYVS